MKTTLSTKEWRLRKSLLRKLKTKKIDRATFIYEWELLRLNLVLSEGVR